MKCQVKILNTFTGDPQKQISGYHFDLGRPSKIGKITSFIIFLCVVIISIKRPRLPQVPPKNTIQPPWSSPD